MFEDVSNSSNREWMKIASRPLLKDDVNKGQNYSLTIHLFIRFGNKDIWGLFRAFGGRKSRFCSIFSWSREREPR
jgi:hypothetical protein